MENSLPKIHIEVVSDDADDVEKGNLTLIPKKSHLEPPEVPAVGSSLKR